MRNTMSQFIHRVLLILTIACYGKAFAQAEVMVEVSDNISFSFVKAMNDDVLTFEESPSGNAIDAIAERLGGYPSALQIYWSVTEQGTTIPGLFRGQKMPIPWARGWAIPFLKAMYGGSPQRATGACADRRFLDQLEDSIPEPRKTYRYLNYSAKTRPDRFHSAPIDAKEGVIPWRAMRHGFVATLTHVDIWRGKVCGYSLEENPHTHRYSRPINPIFVSRTSARNRSNRSTYRGPEIGFQIFDQSWRDLRDGDGKSLRFVIPANSTRQYTWYYQGKTTSLRAFVDKALPEDIFDIAISGRQKEPVLGPTSEGAPDSLTTINPSSIKKAVYDEFAKDIAAAYPSRALQIYHIQLTRQSPGRWFATAFVLQHPYGTALQARLLPDGLTCNANYRRSRQTWQRVGDLRCGEPHTAFSVGGF
ncbi:MAG: hypothetical protein HRU19_26315 [Pseudobacteriovorax sp.]|nr:hypothetical protein [Pseudobacteriovorax sp.]